MRPRNCSKLVKGSKFSIIDLLLGAKSLTLYFIWRVGGCFVACFKKLKDFCEPIQFRKERVIIQSFVASKAC